MPRLEVILLRINVCESNLYGSISWQVGKFVSRVKLLSLVKQMNLAFNLSKWLTKSRTKQEICFYISASTPDGICICKVVELDEKNGLDILTWLDSHERLQNGRQNGGNIQKQIPISRHLWNVGVNSKNVTFWFNVYLES